MIKYFRKISLKGIFDANLHNLHGVEISSNASEAFETHFQNAFKSTQTHCRPAEQILSQFNDAEFDIVYTMAVLQHIHPESINGVTREMYRVSKGYVITHEAEAYSSWRHFPRSYRVIFRRLGAKYLGRVNGPRVFKKAH